MKKSEELIRTELMISYFLRYGVLICLAVIAVGLAARFHGTGHGNHALVQALVSGGAPAEYRPPVGVGELARGALSFDADTVIALGLVMLIGLPILRVALTTLVFLHERDWAFFAITLVVLGVLLSGIIFGRAL